MTSRPTVQQAVPFFWVADIKKSVRYYVEGLGFELSRQWNDDGELRWCWLQFGGAAVMLQEFRKEGAHAFRPAGKLGEGVSIYFICDDATAIFRVVASRGIQASHPVVGNGMWVTELVDPDGYKLAFESATDAPEDSTFRE